MISHRRRRPYSSISLQPAEPLCKSRVAGSTDSSLSTRHYPRQSPASDSWQPKHNWAFTGTKLIELFTISMAIGRNWPRLVGIQLALALVVAITTFAWAADLPPEFFDDSENQIRIPADRAIWLLP